MFFFSTQASADVGPDSDAANALALLILIAAIAGWLGLRALVRRMRAGKTESVVHGAFAEYAREVLVNAARIDGRVSEAEHAAIANALREIAGAAQDTTQVAAALADATLTKDELVAYLAEREGAFSRQQKVQLLKALLAVFVADGHFDETEHAALVDYTAAIGFDRQGAPDVLRGLMGDFKRGNIT
jgi:uncharacterized membrane protein YebE (DUF533 family)